MKGATGLVRVSNWAFRAMGGWRCGLNLSRLMWLCGEGRFVRGTVLGRDALYEGALL